MCLAFVMLMRALAVDGADCSVVSDGGTAQVNLPTTEYVLQGCHWQDAKLEFLADGPFAVVLRNIRMEGGTITVKSLRMAEDPTRRSACTTVRSLAARSA